MMLRVLSALTKGWGQYFKEVKLRHVILFSLEVELMDVAVLQAIVDILGNTLIPFLPRVR